MFGSIGKIPNIVQGLTMKACLYQWQAIPLCKRLSITASVFCWFPFNLCLLDPELGITILRRPLHTIYLQSLTRVTISYRNSMTCLLASI